MRELNELISAYYSFRKKGYNVKESERYAFILVYGFVN